MHYSLLVAQIMHYKFKMNILAEKIINMRGAKTQPEFAKQTNLSLRTICKLERGDSVKLSTLQQIRDRLLLDRSQWIELLTAWIQSEVGSDDFSLVLKRSSTESPEFVLLFNSLSQENQKNIKKALQRPEVLACLGPINKVWEKFDVH